MIFLHFLLRRRAVTTKGTTRWDDLRCVVLHCTFEGMCTHFSLSSEVYLYTYLYLYMCISSLTLVTSKFKLEYLQFFQTFFNLFFPFLKVLLDPLNKSSKDKSTQHRRNNTKNPKKFISMLPSQKRILQSQCITL